MFTYRSLAVSSLFVLALSFTSSSSGATTNSVAPIIHHPVTTHIEAAQAAFDRGLLDYYAYNVEAAEHEFYTAADLDPQMAMAYWGIAQANASDLNIEATEDREQQAEEAISRAQDLEAYASPQERAYIDATAQRFSADPKANRAHLLIRYRDAMQKVSQSNPFDPDAATLYGEAQLYVFAGTNANDKASLTAAERKSYAARMTTLLPFFQEQLRRFPMHVGLLHFYIHAADEANEQAAAVGAAETLSRFQFKPEEAHLTHMPGHIFLKTGMYDDAVRVAVRSVEMDDAAISCCHPGYYSEPRYYHEHNVTFVMFALTQIGSTDAALKAARREGSRYLIARQLVVSKRWDDILRMPIDTTSATLTFARGLAFAARGDRASTVATLDALPVSPDADLSWKDTVAAMKLILQARIAEIDRHEASAIRMLQRAGTLADDADTIGVSEFQDLYFYSPHLALANLAEQLHQQQTARAAYLAELRSVPNSPTARTGLAMLHQ